ncbi:hypothetical protein HCN44_004789 [Aphidius gifuensis]|uniref:Uncharacterized protein n=1 Tax=Aphidius gifuensis TaxID=684658 RepID=A0A834XIW7_APHGI|nr:hypothetical protein HCN44_004789 [Aphidius gifuensis]
MEEDKTQNDHFDAPLVEYGRKYKMKAMQLMASLYARCSLPRKTVHEIVTSFKTFYHTAIDDLKNCLFSTITDNEKINNGFEIYKNFFAGLNTEQKTLKKFEDCGVFIKPVSVPIKSVFKHCLVNSRKTYKNININIISLPLDKQLKHFLELSNVFETIINFINEKNNDSSSKISSMLQDGIVINIEGQQHHVFFHLAKFLGDNLALNEILGFEKSFSALYYCRTRREHRDDCRTLLEEKTNMLRTKENYLTDLKHSTNGVREKFVFDSVFDMFESRTFDIFHDHEEGEYRYLMGCIIHDLIINKKLFNLDYLNERIIPEQHFETHYPRAMEQHGPLREVTTIRGEAKHRFFAKVSSSTTSRRNPALTLSLKHQLYWASRVLEQRPMLKRVDFGVKKKINLDFLENLLNSQDMTFLNSSKSFNSIS